MHVCKEAATEGIRQCLHISEEPVFSSVEELEKLSSSRPWSLPSLCLKYGSKNATQGAEQALRLPGVVKPSGFSSYGLRANPQSPIPLNEGT